jgi:hypothetical protein
LARSGTYEVNGTSAFPSHIIVSTSSAPPSISPYDVHAVFGSELRAFSSTVLAKCSTAISKKMMKKMSMLIACTPSSR